MPVRVALNERDAARSGLLFAVGVIRKDLTQVHLRQVDPPGVGRQTEIEHLYGGRFHVGRGLYPVHQAEILGVGHQRMGGPQPEPILVHAG